MAIQTALIPIQNKKHAKYYHNLKEQTDSLELSKVKIYITALTANRVKRHYDKSESNL